MNTSSLGKVTCSIVLLFSMQIAVAAIEEIEEASAEVEKIVEALKDDSRSTGASDAIDRKSIQRLSAALERGEQINSSLEEQVAKYKAEKEELLKVQTMLSSGLIGALVTAFVAIAGAIISAKSSKPERDLKRLSVIEKAMKLRQEGASLPRDIEVNYVGESDSNTDVTHR
ncbi:MAG: hypothetical protein AAF431_07625 [Pseudomonadota bacterium]